MTHEELIDQRIKLLEGNLSVAKVGAPPEPAPPPSADPTGDWMRAYREANEAARAGNFGATVAYPASQPSGHPAHLSTEAQFQQFNDRMARMERSRTEGLAA